MPVFLRWFLRLGPTNPIAVRLVQNGSRRMRHFYIRSAYLAALIVVLLWSLLTIGSGALSYRDLAEAGARSFTYVAYLQIGLICILAPVFMAGAIAQEANPQTWEVLLTTPLSRVQIVLGNLLGRLFFILALLAASLPLFALTQYFGGVPGRSIFISYGIAASAALLVGTIAIALSVSRLVGRKAVFAFYISVITYLALTAAIDFWLRQGGRGAAGGAGVTWMTGLNPFLALTALLDPSGYPKAELAPGMTWAQSWFLVNPVGTWCAGSVLLSVVLVALSTMTARTGGLGTLAAGASGVPLHRRLLGLGGARAEHRPPRAVWTNPIAWREAAARNATFGRILARWTFIGLGVIFGIALVWLLSSGGLTPKEFQVALLATVWTEIAVTALVAINMAATAVSREREDGTLDLLLTTPITQGQYITGKLRGLIAYLLPMVAVPIGTLLIAGLYVVTDGFGRGGVDIKVTPLSSSTPMTVPVMLPEAGVVAAMVIIPFIAFCVMVGLQWSLKSKGTIGSVVATVGVVGVISAIVALCGWQSGKDVSAVGPVLSALSPASLLLSLVNPVAGVEQTVVKASLTTARIAMFLGAGLAAIIYLAVVYGIHANMVRTFDQTVRRLAGVK